MYKQIFAVWEKMLNPVSYFESELDSIDWKFKDPHKLLVS